MPTIQNISQVNELDLTMSYSHFLTFSFTVRHSNSWQSVWSKCRHRCDVPLTSFSFLNQRRSAAGLLPCVMQVRVMWSPSMAGFVRPSISGFSGTPEGRNGNHCDGTNCRTATGRMCRYATVTLLCFFFLCGNPLAPHTPCLNSWLPSSIPGAVHCSKIIFADTLVDHLSKHTGNSISDLWHSKDRCFPYLV